MNKDAGTAWLAFWYCYFGVANIFLPKTCCSFLATYLQTIHDSILPNVFTCSVAEQVEDCFVTFLLLLLLLLCSLQFLYYCQDDLQKSV